MLHSILEMVSDLIANSRNISSKEKQIVSDEINYAINQTRVHISYTRHGELDKPSSHISNVWQRAGDSLSKIKSPQVIRFAEVIKDKSKYWSSPDLFGETELEKSNMKLVQIERQLKAIINDEN